MLPPIFGRNYSSLQIETGVLKNVRRSWDFRKKPDHTLTKQISDKHLVKYTRDSIFDPDVLKGNVVIPKVIIATG
jgi:hypothetical protein